MRETSNSISKQNSQQPKQFRGDDKKVMKKSLLAFVLAFSLVLSVAVPAFAATPSDVAGKPVQSAVEELTALGIIDGYADGTFKPENNITRAELAKIITIATGNATAATLMQNVKPSFKDVKANVWYTGYINVAAAKGFIQGFNGNFRPSDNVKFEEVVAMLVRALGYKDKYLSGAWPYNVLLQADEIGLFSGLDIAAGTLANRGTVAELASNTLAAKLVTYDADGNKYFANTNGTIRYDGSVSLINKLGSSTNKVVTAVSLNSDKEVSLNGSREDTAASFFVTGGLKLADLLGHTVSVLYNKDGDVLAVTDSQDAKNIITAKSDAITDVATATYIAVNNDAKEYEAAAGLFVFDNTDAQGNTYDLADDKEVKLYLNGDGKVQALLVNDWDANLVVDETVAYKDYTRVTTKNGGSFKVVSSTSITLDGNKAALADLKEYDVVDVIANAAGDAVNVVATRNAISGKLESTGVVAGDVTYKVGGKSYVAIGDADDLVAANIGSEYTYYLNKDGKIVYYGTVNAVDNSQYAVVYEAPAATTDTVGRVIDGVVSQGWFKVVYYSLKDSKKVTAFTKDADVIGLNNKLVELKFDGDGNIALTPLEAAAALDLTSTKVVNEVTASKIVVVNSPSNLNYILNSGTIYLQVKVDGADSTVTVVNAAAVSKNDDVAIKADNGVAKYVVVTSEGDSAELDAVQGLYISRAQVATSATESTYSVNLNVKGEVKTYAIDGGAYSALATQQKYDIVKLTDTLDTNALYETVTPVLRSAESAGLTVNNSARTLTVAGGTFLVTDATQILVTQKTYDSIEVGSFTDVRVAADGTNYGTGSNQYKVVVQGSGTTYGTLQEAGVILVVKY
ncbi:S-layer homology domain-containing protein [Paenibacillus sp. sgz302251]|uniref:S-layer homology domain-containing protein n=1 Tax=Paenibacillus sp. sgz302251 TaxID=3414493 RepID=UPI003C7B073F